MEVQQYNDTILRGLTSIQEMFKKIEGNKQNDYDSSRLYGDGGEKWTQGNDNSENEFVDDNLFLYRKMWEELSYLCY